MKNSINFKNITPVKKASDLSEYDMLQNLRGENNKLQCEKDSLVKLANNRYDEIENLKEIVNQYSNEPQNKSLVSEVIKLKTENLKLKKDNEITQANLGESLRDNEKLESEIKDLKTHLRLIAKLSDYESLGYKL
jgi:hypothetical protein